MGRLGDVVRISVVVGSVIAAAGSATSQPQPPAVSPPPPSSAQQPYSPCEYACGQVSRCNIAPYDACLAQCRQDGTEQQQAGAQHLMVVARTSCEQLQSAMQQAVSAQPAAPSTAAPAGELDVDFDVPPGYTSARQGNMIVLTPAATDDRTPCVYAIGPSRRSTGSLESDAFAALLEPLPGWQRKGDRHGAMRGTSADGWPYHWVRADVQRLAGASYEYAVAMTMAFGAGPNVHVIFGFGSISRCMLDDASFARLFHSLRPRGWRSDGGAALARDLVGLWRNSQDAGMAQYRFKQDGRYELGIGTSATVGVMERTSSSVHDGTYALRDGFLVLTPDPRRRGAEKLRVRVFDELALGRWTRSLATLDPAGTAAREVQYDRIDDGR